MSTQSSITIEQLAEKLNGKLWVKEDLKRIYLDRGYNTKKMSTKTYVFQRADGSFGVSCYIDCPSQAPQWIESQKNEVIEGVMEDIEETLATEYYVVLNENGEYINDNRKPVALDCIYESDRFLTEAAAAKWIKAEYLDNCTIKCIDRAEFEAEVDRLEEIDRVERENQEALKPAEEKIETPFVVTEKVLHTETPEFGVGTKVSHGRFGEGVVLGESNNQIQVDFTSVGSKSLLKQFAKLTKV